MKSILIFLISFLIFSACANVETPVAADKTGHSTIDTPSPKTTISSRSVTSHIGTRIPNFKNDKIDSLVRLYEEDRGLFYKAQAENDMKIYIKSKTGKRGNYNVSDFYENVIKILNTDADMDELKKFQDYISESSAKSREFMSKIKK